MKAAILSTFLLGLSLTGTAYSAEIPVNGDIAVDTTWTANNTYNLQRQIYVLPGASLTIEAGVVIASDTNVGGSLAITRGGQIFANGTKDNPIIFTSKSDVATWNVDGSHPTGKDPKSGAWREAANEWGNITIMGEGYVGSCIAGNVEFPDCQNESDMEGLQRGPATDRFGGCDDDDDSGTLKYVSLRYGGKVVALTNELNGLSLGGVGQETDIHHIEIMNNVDDGIEVWGGCVNLKYFSIWNVGDDSLDIDQGWRGKAQFGLIVQGFSLDASQGSGVGDNCVETDGAEESDYQPVTTTTIYNLTVIGQPQDGDHGTAWRDGARVQYRNCIFMDLGDELVRFDNVDGDPCGTGYGFSATLPWLDGAGPDVWDTPFNNVPAHPNDPPNRNAFYKAQSSGLLSEMKDSVFYNNLSPNAYTTATAVGVLNGSNNNVVAVGSPILNIVRDAPILKGGKVMERVITLDPRPNNDARNSVSCAPDDGFFSAHKYRGAFGPGNNWLCTWTASQAFGFTPTDCQWCVADKSTAGATCAPYLFGTGSLTTGSNTTFALRDARPNSAANLIIGFSELCSPVAGGTLFPTPNVFVLGLPTDANGRLNLTSPWPAGLPAGFKLYFQYLVADPAGPAGFSFSNGLIAISQ